MNAFGCDFNQALGDLLALLQIVAVYQVLREAGDSEQRRDDDDYDPRIERIAEQISPEDCQLFYQIGLLGRRDLALAPDPRGGFEMTLLRMLAFRRSSQTEGAKRLSKASPPRKIAASRADDELASESAGMSVAGAPAWNEIIDSLRLSGLERELASNCVLESFDDTRVKLLLSPELAHLRNEKIEKRLQDRLRSYLDSAAVLDLQVASAIGQESPVQAKARQEQELDEEAARAISADPKVRALCEHFDATIEQTLPR